MEMSKLVASCEMVREANLTQYFLSTKIQQNMMSKGIKTFVRQLEIESVFVI